MGLLLREALFYGSVTGWLECGFFRTTAHLMLLISATHGHFQHARFCSVKRYTIYTWVLLGTSQYTVNGTGYKVHLKLLSLTIQHIQRIEHLVSKTYSLFLFLFMIFWRSVIRDWSWLLINAGIGLLIRVGRGGLWYFSFIVGSCKGVCKERFVDGSDCKPSCRSSLGTAVGVPVVLKENHEEAVWRFRPLSLGLALGAGEPYLKLRHLLQIPHLV